MRSFKKLNQANSAVMKKPVPKELKDTFVVLYVLLHSSVKNQAKADKHSCIALRPTKF